MKKFLFLLLLISPLKAASNLSPGNVFPNLELHDISTGEPASMKSHLKKKTILHIFASW